MGDLNMKKNIIIISMLLTLPLLMTSCLKDQEDTFDRSASARMTDYLNNVAQVLKSAPNGWVLNYYPDREQKYGSYIYSMKFDGENVEVTSPDLVAEEILEDNTPIVSTYRLVADDGPVLTFDTYNDAVHFFATPTGEEDMYEAYDGDFEFIVLGVSDDQNTITLKGKRSGNVMTMNRLNYDRDTYFEIVDSIREKVAEYPVLMCYVGEAKLKVAYGSDSYSLEYTGDDGKMVTKRMPYHVTDEGVIFYEPIKLGEATVKGFYWKDSEETALPLMGVDNVVLTESTDLLDQFIFGLWYMDKDDLTGDFKTGYDLFDTGSAGFGGITSAIIGTNDGHFGFWAIVGPGYVGAEYFDYSTEGEDLITIEPTGKGNQNGTYFISNANMGELTKAFGGQWKLEKDALVPTVITMTNTKDNTKVLRLYAK